MTNVKDQRGCGSCWAFAANSAFEGTIGAKRKRARTRFSEQQAVDCTTDKEYNRQLFGGIYYSSGCKGGWMTNVWRFQKEQGAMRHKHYGYRAKE